MYMDESGQANLADASKYFVLSGIMVEDKIDADLSAYLRYLKRRHSLDENVALHAYDILENKQHANYLKEAQKCKNFTASIAEFVENAPFVVLVCYLDKDELRELIKAPNGYKFKGNKSHKADKELSYEILGRKLIFEFAKLVKKNKAIGSIVAESRRSADSVLLRAYLDAQDPQAFVNQPAIAKQASIAKEFVHSICFASKKSLNGALELVDIISYCTHGELTSKFPSQRNDKRGVKAMWLKIKKQMGTKAIQKISKSAMRGIAPDRINETSKHISARLAEFGDLVNPTG